MKFVDINKNTNAIWILDDSSMQAVPSAIGHVVVMLDPDRGPGLPGLRHNLGCLYLVTIPLWNFHPPYPLSDSMRQDRGAVEH